MKIRLISDVDINCSSILEELSIIKFTAKCLFIVSFSILKKCLYGLYFFFRRGFFCCFLS